MNATKRPRQTAGNNPALKAIKAEMNATIYKRSLDLMNAAGPEAVHAYLCGFFNAESRGRVNELMAGQVPDWTA